MDGLDFGWRKTVKQYHFFDEGSLSSLCCHIQRDTSEFKEFLQERELTTNMNICQICYRRRTKRAVSKIKDHHKATVGGWDDTCVCPNCKAPVIFFNAKKTKEHFCTICKENVIFQ